jgi:hypothetical protein
MAGQDFRARLSPKSVSAAKKETGILGPADQSNILWPLHATNGILFPYTPSVTAGSQAEYDLSPFIHSNYGYNAYVRSYPKPINISTEFTAQSDAEAFYMLAVIHFFKSSTKLYFGVQTYKTSGTPPPVLLFNYLGDHQFNDVPVVVKSFGYTLDAAVDYVPVYTAGLNSNGDGLSLPAGKSNGYSWVPTHIKVEIELETQYTPIKTRNNFNLDKFRSGNLITGGYI